MRREVQREGRYKWEGEESRQPVDEAHETRQGENEKGPAIDQRRLTICPLHLLRFDLRLCTVLLSSLPLLTFASFQRVLSLCSTFPLCGFNDSKASFFPFAFDFHLSHLPRSTFPATFALPTFHTKKPPLFDPLYPPMSAFNILRPTLQSLSVEEPSLVSLANSVYETLHASKEDRIAQNAARMYLAMIAGFEQAGLMTSSCAPSIWIQTSTGNHEVRFRVTLVSRCTEELTSIHSF